MTHTLHITNNTLSRRRRHLRTHHDASIQLPTWQALMTPAKSRANRAYADKPNPALGPMGPVQRVWQIRVTQTSRKASEKPAP